MTFTKEGWREPSCARKWSMYSATLLVSEPQSLTIGLPGGMLLGTDHLVELLWILGTRYSCLFLELEGTERYSTCFLSIDFLW